MALDETRARVKSKAFELVGYSVTFKKHPLHDLKPLLQEFEADRLSAIPDLGLSRFEGRLDETLEKYRCRSL